VIAKTTSDAVASHSVGLASTKKYEWMHAGNVPSSLKPKPRIEPQVIAPEKGGTGTSEPGVLDRHRKVNPLPSGNKGV